MKYNYRIILAITLLTLVAAIGMTGYIIIEGYSYIDALYMTVITVSTVGYGEVFPLSPHGKVFTIFLLVLSLGVVAYSISIITSHLVEHRLEYLIKGRSNNNEIKKMKEHVILCGYGRNGRQAAEDLKMHRKPFLIIEKSHEIIQENEEKGFVFVEGDATEDHILKKAGIEKATALITALPIDADNLFVVLSARAMNPKVMIISRSSDDSASKKLRVAGANHVVMPDKVGGSHMATLVARPDVVEFLYHLSIQEAEGVNLIEIVCSDLPAELHNKTIHELSIRRLSGANIVGYKSPEGEFIINPGPDTLMLRNAKLFVLGTPDQISMMKEIIKLKRSV